MTAPKLLSPAEIKALVELTVPFDDEASYTAGLLDDRAHVAAWLMGLADALAAQEPTQAEVEALARADWLHWNFDPWPPLAPSVRAIYLERASCALTRERAAIVADRRGIAERLRHAPETEAAECETCGGLGRMRVMQDDDVRRASDGWRKCLDCNGTGRAAVMAKPWTEAHRREALRRTYELAAEQSAAGEDKSAHNLALGPIGAFTEATWRDRLTSGCGFDAARIDREVRRVRALAGGRLVRETSERWEVRDYYGGDSWLAPNAERAREVASEWREKEDGAGVRPRACAARVRVTRIRRATR